MKVSKFKVNGGETRAHNAQAHSTKMKLMNQRERNFHFLLCASEKETVNENSAFPVHSFRSAKIRSSPPERPSWTSGTQVRASRAALCALLLRSSAGMRSISAVPCRMAPDSSQLVQLHIKAGNERTHEALNTDRAFRFHSLLRHFDPNRKTGSLRFAISYDSRFKWPFVWLRCALGRAKKFARRFEILSRPDEFPRRKTENEVAGNFRKGTGKRTQLPFNYLSPSMSFNFPPDRR